MLILNKENDVLQVNSINEHNIKNIDLLTKQVNSFFEYLNREDIIKMLNSEKYDNIFYLYLYYNIKEKLFLLSKELKDKEKQNMLGPLFIDDTEYNRNLLLSSYETSLKQEKNSILIKIFLKLLNESIVNLNKSLYEFYLNDDIQINYKCLLNIPTKYLEKFPNHKKTKCIEGNFSRYPIPELETNIESVYLQYCTLSNEEALYAFNNWNKENTDWNSFFNCYHDTLLTLDFIKENYAFVLDHSNMKQMYEKHYETAKKLLYYYFVNKNDLSKWKQVFIDKYIEINNDKDYYFYAQSPYQHISYDIKINDLYDVIDVLEVDKNEFQSMLTELSDFIKNNDVFLKNKEKFFQKIRKITDKDLEHNIKTLLSLENKVKEIDF